MRRLLVVMAMALSFVGLGAQAQEPAARRLRVRIHSVNDVSGTLEGSLVSANADTFKVRVERRLVAISAHSIERIEVAEGSRHYAVRGALIGAVLGGLIYRFQPLGCDSKGGCGVGEAIEGALVGAGVGGLIGLNIHGDRWVEVRPEILHTSRTPSSSGLRIQPKIINGFGLSGQLTLGGGS